MIDGGMTTAAEAAPAEPDDRALVTDLSRARAALIAEVQKRIVGQRDVIDQLLVALFARGHCLFVGVPGLAKTLLIQTLADVLSLEFSRIQFTPDLMPSDITGTDVLEEDPVTRARSFRFIRGPVFANLVLADEINRTPPKTQAALLQAMQEHRVTAGGRTHDVGRPFLVFATQNPIEQEGTYPLPEAELDRFMFQVDVDYPGVDDEVAIVQQQTSPLGSRLDKVLGPERILQLQGLVLRVPAADHVVRYAVKLVRATRPKGEAGDAPPAFVRDYVAWGAGPRASKDLILGAKARAVLDGRFAASIEDVRALARPTLAHRVVLGFRAEAERISAADVVARVLESVQP